MTDTQFDGAASAVPPSAIDVTRGSGHGLVLDRLRELRLSGGGIYAASVAATGVASIVFHLLAIRALGVAGYSALGSLLAFMMMLSVPVGSVQTLLSARVSRAAEGGARIAFARLARRGTAIGFAVAGTVWAFSPVVVGFLHLRSFVPVLWLGAYLIPLAAGIVFWSVLCGTGHLGWVGFGATAGFAVRLGVGALLLAVGFGVSGAMAATVVGECVVTTILGVGAMRCGRRRAAGSEPGEAVDLDLRLREAAQGSLAAMGLWALLGVDLVAARHYLTPEQAGLYATTALGARAVLAVAQTAATASLRRFASGDEDSADNALHSALCVVVSVGAAGTVLLGAVGPRLLGVLFSHLLHADARLDVLLALDATALAALSVLVQFRLASRGHATMAGWAGSMCFAGCLVVLPATPIGLAVSMSAGAACALLIAMPRPSGPAEPTDRGSRSLLVSPRKRAEPEAPGVEPALSGPGTVALSVIVPYFNPGNALRPTVDRLIEVLSTAGLTFEIIAVCDGSTDDSAQRLAAVRDARLLQVAHPCNRGKGAALRTGFAQARGRYVGFIDGDGDLDPGVLPDMHDAAESSGLDAVVGAKRYAAVPGAGRQGARRVFSCAYRTFVRALFALTVRDTQTGVKIFRREVIAEVLPRCRQDRYAIDLELLAWMHRLGYCKVREVPVALERQGTSTVTAFAVVKLLLDTISLWLRLATVALRRSVGAEAGAGLRRPVIPLLGEPFGSRLAEVLALALTATRDERAEVG